LGWRTDFLPTILGRVLIYGSVDELHRTIRSFTRKDQTKMLPTAPLGFFICDSRLHQPASRAIDQERHLPSARMARGRRCRPVHAQPVRHRGCAQKIAASTSTDGSTHRNAEVASHLYFADSNYEPWFTFLRTHPPLSKRISAIDPAFDGNFPKVKMLRPPV